MNRLVLIDTLNFFHRAFHAYPSQLTTLQGEPINAVFGFATMLFSLVVELEPTHLAVAYESEKEPTFRTIEFPEYKATRVPLPPEEQVRFDPQLALLEEFIGAAKIAELRAEGFEADDLIGTVAKKLTVDSRQSTEIIIASNDRDLMQLIDGRIRFYLPVVGKGKAKFYGRREFVEEYGFAPENLVDYKALRGDPSDNIPGVRGIGEKTGAELVRRYGTLEDIYKNVLELKPSVVEKLNVDKDKAKLSKRLATIVTDAPVEFRLEELEFRGFNNPEVRELFTEWGFKSLLKKISDQRPENSDQVKMAM